MYLEKNNLKNKNKNKLFNMKTSHLIINDGNLIIIPYQGEIFRRMKNGIVKKAGWQREDGYCLFQYKGFIVYKHRFIYQQFYKLKLTQDSYIDHLDLNPKNNNITNLRAVSHQQNCQNRTYNKNNKLGFKNIRYRKDMNKYEVRIRVNGTNNNYGWFEKLEDAIQKRDEAYIELNSQGHIFRC